MVGPGAFVNLHSPLFPEGELRGQLQNLLVPPIQLTQQSQLQAPAPSPSLAPPMLMGVPPVIAYKALNSSQAGTVLGTANLFVAKPGELYVNVFLIASISGDFASSLSNVREVSLYSNAGPPANDTIPVMADYVTSRPPFSFAKDEDPRTGVRGFNLFHNGVDGLFTVNAVVQQVNNASIVVAASYVVAH